MAGWSCRDVAAARQVPALCCTAYASLHWLRLHFGVLFCWPACGKSSHGLPRFHSEISPALRRVMKVLLLSSGSHPSPQLHVAVTRWTFTCVYVSSLCGQLQHRSWHVELFLLSFLAFWVLMPHRGSRLRDQRCIKDGVRSALGALGDQRQEAHRCGRKL